MKNIGYKLDLRRRRDAAIQRGIVNDALRATAQAARMCTPIHSGMMCIIISPDDPPHEGEYYWPDVKTRDILKRNST